MRGIWKLGFAALLAGCTAPVGDENVGEVEQESVVCGTGGAVIGIDVSYYQGKPNWKAVAGSGIRFAIARVNDGSFITSRTLKTLIP